MKRILAISGALALGLAIVPMAHAEPMIKAGVGVNAGGSAGAGQGGSGSSGEIYNGGVQMNAGASSGTGGTDASASGQAKAREEMGETGQQQTREHVDATTSIGSANRAGWEGTSTATTSEPGDRDRIQLRDQDRIHLELESSTTPVYSADQLRQSIQLRQHQLDQQASSSAQFGAIVRNENQVRLAVHALLAAKDMLGGIGPQVAQIATQMNQSVATTSNAQAQIQARGFWSRLFFGGDTNAAQVLTQEVTANQARIAQLNQLINSASISADVKTQLQTQLQTATQEQARLQDLATQQQNAWGIFSWRF